MGRQRHEGIETADSIFSQLFSNIYYRERPYIKHERMAGMAYRERLGFVLGGTQVQGRRVEPVL